MCLNKYMHMYIHTQTYAFIFDFGKKYLCLNVNVGTMVFK